MLPMYILSSWMKVSCTTILVVFICGANTFFESFFESEMDAHGEPSALSIVRRWRAQRLAREEEERNLQHEKELITEHFPFRPMCAAGGVTKNNTEQHYGRMKKARAKQVDLVLCSFAHVCPSP